MSDLSDENLIAKAGIIGSCIFSIWIISQCVWIIYKKTYQNHQAFKIRGQIMFILTAFILILNFALRPVLVSISLMDVITMNWFWRLIIDAAQMSLYSIIELRCWMEYFNLNYSTAIVDREWQQFLYQQEETSNFFIKYHKYLGHYLYVGIFFSFHGIFCVVICGLVEEYYGFDPDRIICHFFAANILLFGIFIHRMYVLLLCIKHTYSHDMLAVNKELNMITIIMTITAICDTVLDIWYQKKAAKFYVVYQTILIGLLSIIIFYLPRITIRNLLKMENERNSEHMFPLKHVFYDTDSYYSLIRFMSHEWTVENLLFISQWMQIQKIIVDSEIDVEVNPIYTCHGDAASLALLSNPSDILLLSNNILEAARCIYDKFVKTHWLINISHQARVNLESFFRKYTNIRSIIEDAYNNVNANNCNNMEKYHMFIKQLKENEIDINIIQEMIDSFNYAVRMCWINTKQSFQRFRSTISYKKLSCYMTVPDNVYDDDNNNDVPDVFTPMLSPRRQKSVSYSTPLQILWE